MDQLIPLSQKLYLLGIHPEKGGLISATYRVIGIVVTGALFLELFQNKNIRFEQKKVILLNDKTSNPLHRFMLEKIKLNPKPHRLSTWITKFHYSQKYLLREIRKGLAERRLIKMEPHQFLFFRWEKSKILNPQMIYRLVSDIETRIFKGTEDEGEIMLLSMLKPAGLIKRIFPERGKRKGANEKLKTMLTDNPVSVAVSDAVAAAQAVAASVAVTVATAHG